LDFWASSFRCCCSDSHVRPRHWRRPRRRPSPAPLDPLTRLANRSLLTERSTARFCR